MRRLTLLPLLLAFSGCGTVERSPALAPVRLTVESPADRSTVDDESVEVRGTVLPPGARVLVAGAEAEVSAGAFAATVALDSGTNVIDVQAGAPRRAAAMAALRVTRLVPVEIPELEGLSVDDAVAALEALDLEADVRVSGGLIDEILGGTPTVCFTSPGADQEVRADSTVIVEAAPGC